MRVGTLARKVILVVDDDTLFLDILTTGLQLQLPGVDVIGASCGTTAIQFLQTKPVDLVVTDLCIPDIDGFDVLFRVRQFCPEVPVIIMTGFGFAEVNDFVRNLGCSLYLEKPFDVDMLARFVEQILARDTEGRVSGFTLVSFLQLMELDKKTSTLRVLADGRDGVLCFRDGRLVFAATSSLQGESAAFEILRWQDPEIRIFNFCQNDQANIDLSLPVLLMESCKALDESAAPGGNSQS